SAPAFADNKQIAREAFRDGTRYYDLAEFAKALEEIKKAYFNFEDPVFLFNIAQCHRQLGDKQDAVRFYKTYLRKLPGAPNRDEVQRTIATLESMLEKEKASRIEPPTGT